MNISWYNENVVQFLVAALLAMTTVPITVGFSPVITGVRRTRPFVAQTTQAVSSSTSLDIGVEVGSGSYGTVHLCEYDGKTMICKRAWDEVDLDSDSKNPKERAERCQY